MRRFIIKVVIFTVLFFLLDKCAYFLLQRSISYENDHRLEQLINGQINKDIIIAGSSRGAKGIIAQQIEDSTGYTTYNLSYAGTNLAFHEFIVRTLFKFNQPPKLLLLVVDDPYELWEHERSNFRSDKLLRLVAYNHVNNELIKVGDRPFVSKFLYTARLSKEEFFLEYKPIFPFDTMMVCGSQPISYYAEDQDFHRYQIEYDSTRELDWKRQQLARIEQYCEEHQVKLILVYPPNYKIHNPDFEARMRTLMRPEVQHFVYDTQDSAYLQKSFYHDADHLHVSGARYFTDELIEYIDSLQIK